MRGITKAVRDFCYRRLAREIICTPVGQVRVKYEDRSVLELILIAFQSAPCLEGGYCIGNLTQRS